MAVMGLDDGLTNEYGGYLIAPTRYKPWMIHPTAFNRLAFNLGAF
jgi:hypothetical protein